MILLLWIFLFGVRLGWHLQNSCTRFWQLCTRIAEAVETVDVDKQFKI